jgi:hypothetical protein
VHEATSPTVMVRRTWWALLLCLCATRCTAHPSILECNGLSARLAANATIMNFPIQRTTLGQAPFTLKRATGQLDSRGSMWTNYTITGRLTAEVLLELVPGDSSNNLTSFPKAPICGSGGDDGGLCPTAGCYSQLYAMLGDCTGDETCLFGVASAAAAPAGAARNATLLLAWAEGGGGSVTYTRVNLSTV